MAFNELERMFNNIPQEQFEIAERAKAFAFAVAARGTDANYWPARIQQRQAEQHEGIVQPPEPHSCHHCQKVVIDITKPVDPMLLRTRMPVNPKWIDFNVSLNDIQQGADEGCPLMFELRLDTRSPTPEEESESTFRLAAFAAMREANGFDLTTVYDLHVADKDRPYVSLSISGRDRTTHGRSGIRFDVHAEDGTYTMLKGSRLMIDEVLLLISQVILPQSVS